MGLLPAMKGIAPAVGEAAPALPYDKVVEPSRELAVAPDRYHGDVVGKLDVAIATPSLELLRGSCCIASRLTLNGETSAWPCRILICAI